MLERPRAMPRPPGRTPTVDRAASGDRDVPQAATADERGVRELVAALPAGFDHRVVRRVVAPEKDSARFEVQGDVVPQRERARQIAPGRDGPSAPARRLVDGCLERAGVVGDAVGDGARHQVGGRAHSLIAPIITPFTK